MNIDGREPQRAARPLSGGRMLAVGGFGLLLPMLGSCTSRPEIARVRGTVSQAGRPLEGVMVTFMPDPQRGTDGAVSTGITDRDGRFELDFRGESGAKGALVGYHRVVVKDVALENTRDESIRPRNRVPQKYRLAARTPLSYQVSIPMQPIEIDVPPP